MFLIPFQDPDTFLEISYVPAASIIMAPLADDLLEAERRGAPLAANLLRPDQLDAPLSCAITTPAEVAAPLAGDAVGMEETRPATGAGDIEQGEGVLTFIDAIGSDLDQAR